jgi:phosphoribosylanthranilate isomerase
MRAVLQCQGAFPPDAGVDWLFDVSFGTGAAAREWPPLADSQPFCGYAGGLGPDNVHARLARAPVAPGVRYWIDMESGVRTEGQFDTAKCAAVCEAVFGT